MKYFNSYYKCIVTLKNGTHRIVRMTLDAMATLVAAFRSMQNDPWLTERHVDAFRRYELTPCDVFKLLFINESTGDRLEVA